MPRNKSKPSRSTGSSKTSSRGTRTARRRTQSRPPVRYALVGLGHIAQAAVLPAFRHSRGAQLAALVSDDQNKLQKLGRKYSVKAQYHYDNLENCIRNEGIEAVYIALPNSLHRDYTLRSLANGAHVLCEKPLATTTEDARTMIEAAERAGLFLMTAYRLHFDRANLEAIDFIKRGRIGDPLLFTSTFSYQVREDNIRRQRELGGGALLDIGIYCINAARYIFQAEPEAVAGHLVFGNDDRFTDVEGTCVVQLIFPQGRLAQFGCSFSAAPTSAYEVLGTKGIIRLDPAYEYESPLAMSLTVNEKTTDKKFKRSDQFAAELEYFAECIRSDREPEPNGYEGLADLRIIEAVRESSRRGTLVTLGDFQDERRPSLSQARQEKPAPDDTPLVDVESPSA